MSRMVVAKPVSTQGSAEGLQAVGRHAPWNTRMHLMSRRKYDDGFDNFRRVDRIIGFVLDEIRFLATLVLLCVGSFVLYALFL